MLLWLRSLRHLVPLLLRRFVAVGAALLLPLTFMLAVVAAASWHSMPLLLRLLPVKTPLPLRLLSGI